jgi:hypothetical protein
LAQVEYPGEMTLERPGHRQIMRVRPKDLLDGTLVFGHVMATGNFLFASPQFRAWISEQFPSRRLEGEKLLGARAPSYRGKLGSVTLLIVIIAFGGTLYGGITRGLPRFFDPALLANLLWLVSYVAVIAYVGDLDQPEAWLFALVPFCCFSRNWFMSDGAGAMSCSCSCFRARYFFTMASAVWQC